MTDLKFFALLAVLGGGIVFFIFGDFKNPFRRSTEEHRTPTIQFVSKGTPGAKTWEELQQDRDPNGPRIPHTPWYKGGDK